MAARSLAVALAGLLVLGATSTGPSPTASAAANPPDLMATDVVDVADFLPGGATAIDGLGTRLLGFTGIDPNNPYTVLSGDGQFVATVPTPYLSPDGGWNFDGTGLRPVGGATTPLPALPDSYAFDPLVGADLSNFAERVAFGATRPGVTASTIFLGGFGIPTVSDLRGLLPGTAATTSLTEPALPTLQRGVAFVETEGGFGCVAGPSCFSRVRYLPLDDSAGTGEPDDVAVTPEGERSAGRSWAPQVSLDGRYVSFVSDATDLVSGADTPAVRLYRRDRLTKTTLLVAADVSASGEVEFSMNDFGNRIAYVSGEAGEHVMIADVGSATVPLLQSAGGPSCSRAPELSGDGRKLLFFHCAGTTVEPVGAPSTIGVQLATLDAPPAPLLIIIWLPTRLLDTRLLLFLFQAYTTKRLQIPSDDSSTSRIAAVAAPPAAAVLNVTATGPKADGFLTVWSCDEPQPTASNVNYRAGQTIPNAVVTAVSRSGEVCIYSHAETDVVVDVNGTFAQGSAFVPVTPRRVLDTRTSEDSSTPPQAAGGSVTVLHPLEGTGLPRQTEAVSLNITATKAAASGFVTAYPCGTDIPTASNLNYVAGDTIPNAAIVPVAPDGTVCLYTHADVDLLVDVNGGFPSLSGYHGVTPARLLDTRAGETDTVANLPGDSVVTVPVAGRGGVPEGAVSAVLNVTATNPGASGFVTVWPCGTERPEASSLNYVAGQTIPNMVVATLAADGTACLYTKAAADLVVDVNGYLTA